MLNRDQKGMVLFIVLGIIMVVVILSTVVLRIVADQARLTHHMVSRIRAQYAAKAGMVWALEMLRTGVKSYPADCTKIAPCVITESFPSVNSVNVIFCPAGDRISADASYCTPPSGYSFCVSSTADFTYTP